MANTSITPSTSESSNITYDGNTTVKDKLDSLSTDVSSKVSNTGGTISGDVTINAANGTAGLAGWSGLILGNSTPQETAGNSTGYVRLFGRNDKRIDIYPGTTLTDDRNLTLPDKSGTIALTSDIFSRISDVYIQRTQTNSSGNLEFQASKMSIHHIFMPHAYFILYITSGFNYRDCTKIGGREDVSLISVDETTGIFTFGTDRVSTGVVIMTLQL